MTPILIVALILTVTGVIMIWIFWANAIGAGWQPTSRRRVRKMLEMAKVDSNDIIYDLGSGDGRIVMDAAKKYNARAVGMEADPLRVLWSRLIIIRSGLRSSAKIIWGNFFHHDISEATVVTLFLSDTANQKLKSKFQEELKPGTRIVSYVWMFKGWEPVKMDKDDEIYLYIIGQSDSPYKNEHMGFYSH